MRILKKSITNSVIYSIISLVYSVVLIYVGTFNKRMGLDVSVFHFKVIGICILFLSVIVQMLIVSTTQTYDEYKMNLFMKKIVMSTGLSILLFLIAIILSLYLWQYNIILLLTLLVIHWFILSVLEIFFLYQIK